MIKKTVMCIANLCLILISCDESNIPNFEGDGTISHIGNQKFYSGYKIEFCKIDLSKKYKKNSPLKIFQAQSMSTSLACK